VARKPAIDGKKHYRCSKYHGPQWTALSKNSWMWSQPSDPAHLLRVARRPSIEIADVAQKIRNVFRQRYSASTAMIPR
jgi:hypothetical protein